MRLQLPVAPLACPICKMIRWLPRDERMRGLCRRCSERLWLLRQPVERKNRGYVVRSLFSWREGDPPALRWWIRSLKRNERRVLWREPALWLLDAFGSPFRGNVLVVPIPGVGARVPNHSRGLATALASEAEWEVADLLEFCPEAGAKVRRSQKRLGLHERWARRFQLRKVPNRHYSAFIVVDDVVTSGATAEAAYQALGRPRNCEIWCLLDRRPPCAPCGRRSALI